MPAPAMLSSAPPAGFAASVDLAALDGSDGFRLDGAAADDRSGSSVSAAGDVNGDGIDDLIVGAPGRRHSWRTYAGASYVVFGTAAGFAASVDLAALDGSDGFRLDGAASGDHSGSSVSAAGDVNGDGIDDLIVGLPARLALAATAGASYVVFGTDVASRRASISPRSTAATASASTAPASMPAAPLSPLPATSTATASTT